MRCLVLDDAAIGVPSSGWTTCGGGLPGSGCAPRFSGLGLKAPVSCASMLRTLFLLGGFLCVGLAVLGVVVPGLPTTPFLLLAAACFARSSERFYAWLVGNRVFGPMIRDWRATRSMSRRSKIIALASIVVVGGASVVFVIEHNLLKAVVAAFLLCPIVIVSRIPTTERLTGPRLGTVADPDAR